MLSIVLVCALLTYGGVSLFVVVFAVYPFAAEMFRQSDIPKRLIPATIALGAFTFTMDALPGTPQIQNIIPTTFFGTDTWAAPVLGMIGARLHPGGRPDLPGVAAAPGAGRRRRLRRPTWSTSRCLHRTKGWPIPGIAILPLVLVGVSNKVFTCADPDVLRRQPRVRCRRWSAMPRRWCRKSPRSPRSGRSRARCWSASSRCCCSPGSRCRARFADGSQAGHRRRPAGLDEHRFGVRLRRGHRRPARLPGHRRRAARDPRPAGQRGGHASPRWPASPARPPAA